MLQNFFYLIFTPELSIRMIVIDIFKTYIQNPDSDYLNAYFLPQLVRILKDQLAEEVVLKSAC